MTTYLTFDVHGVEVEVECEVQSWGGSYYDPPEDEVEIESITCDGVDVSDWIAAFRLENALDDACIAAATSAHIAAEEAANEYWRENDECFAYGDEW